MDELKSLEDFVKERRELGTILKNTQIGTNIFFRDIFTSALLLCQGEEQEDKPDKPDKQDKPFLIPKDRYRSVVNILDWQIHSTRAEITIPKIKGKEVGLFVSITDEKGFGLSGTKIVLTNKDGERIYDDPIPTERGAISIKMTGEARDKIKDDQVFFSVMKPDGTMLYEHKEPVMVREGEHQLVKTVIRRGRAYPNMGV